jgi:type IV pilus assembly protein PilN
MIRINLLGVTTLTKSNDSEVVVDSELGVFGQDVQRLAMVRLAILMIVPLGLYLWEFQMIPQKKTKIAQLNSRLRELENKNSSAKKSVDEMNRVREQESILQKQILVIENLRKDRLLEVKLLDLIQKQIPPKLWLSKIELKDKAINFHGTASTDVELTTFMDILSKANLVSQVNLVRSSEQANAGIIVKKFEVRCDLPVTKPVEEISAKPERTQSDKKGKKR